MFSFYFLLEKFISFLFYFVGFFFSSLKESNLKFVYLVYSLFLCFLILYFIFIHLFIVSLSNFFIFINLFFCFCRLVGVASPSILSHIFNSLFSSSMFRNMFHAMNFPLNMTLAFPRLHLMRFSLLFLLIYLFLNFI